MILVPDGGRKRKAEERVNVKRSKPSETEEVHNSSDSEHEENANLSQDSEWNLSEFEAECMMGEIAEIVKKQKNNTVDIFQIAMVALKYKVSAPAATAIVNTTVLCFFGASEDHRHLLISVGKMEFAMENERKRRLEVRNLVAQNLDGFGFDGRIDRETKTLKLIGNRNYVVPGGSEKHITIVGHPWNNYLSHILVPPKKNDETRSPAKIESDILLEELVSVGAKKEKIEFIQSDSEPTNTGAYGGVIYFTEVSLGRKLNVSICLLHINELPWKLLVKLLGCRTLSDEKWEGPIGALIPKASTLPFNENFEQITGPPLPDLTPEQEKNISRDQKMLYRLARLILTGKEVPNLESLNMGAAHNARWLNLCTIMLRIWVSHHNLDKDSVDKLRTICEWILRVYVPMWFRVTRAPEMKNGSWHYFEMIKSLKLVNLRRPLQMLKGRGKNRALTDTTIEQEIKDNLIHNSYWLHSESILTSLLSSEREADRVFAVNRISTIRSKQENQEIGDMRPRNRINPTNINWDAEELSMVISLDDYQHEPALTCKIASKDLKEFIKTPLEVKNWPSHTQAVERNVQNVTEASKQYATKEKQAGSILSKQYTNSVLGPKKNKDAFLQFGVATSSKK